MIDCNVINDLLFVYAAGEASPETQRLLESHMETCPECAKAIERARLADGLLDNWEEPAANPDDGRRFIGRLQRLIFIISSGILLAFAASWAVWHRLILLEILQAERIQLQLPWQLVIRPAPLVVWLVVAGLVLVVAGYWWQQPQPEAVPVWYTTARGIIYALVGLLAYFLAGSGDLPAIVIGSALLLASYLFGLRWRLQQPAVAAGPEWVRSGLTAVPLLGLVLLLLNTILSGQVPGLFIALASLFVGLAYTYHYLARVPYLLSVTLFSLLLANGLLALRALQTFARLIANT